MTYVFGDKNIGFLSIILRLWYHEYQRPGPLTFKHKYFYLSNLLRVKVLIISFAVEDWNAQHETLCRVLSLNTSLEMVITFRCEYLLSALLWSLILQCYSLLCKRSSTLYYYSSHENGSSANNTDWETIAAQMAVVTKWTPMVILFAHIYASYDH